MILPVISTLQNILRQQKYRTSLLAAFVLIFSGAMPGCALAQVFCVYDPLGSGGDYFSTFKDFQIAAKEWGVNLELRPYTDDDLLNQDFQSGNCDMASMIGMRARQYNRFSGTLDAPGVMENYVQVRMALRLMASTQLAPNMVSGNYEIAGILPIGAAFLITSDRRINNIAGVSGKTVAVMRWDKAQSMLAAEFKAIPVPLNITEFGPLFNKGKVKLIVMPMAFYKSLELENGIGSQGGIIRRPLHELTMQLVLHHDKFPASFGQRSREYIGAQTDHAIALARNYESKVDEHKWIYSMHGEITSWEQDVHGLLARMTQQGIYDMRMLELLRRIRCKTDADKAECASLASASL